MRRRLIRSLATLIIATLATGCAGTLRPDAADVARVRAEPVIHVGHGTPPAFIVGNTGATVGAAAGAGIALGVFGGALAAGIAATEVGRVEGAELVRLASLEDPAPRVVERLRAGLGSRAGLQGVRWVLLSNPPSNDPFLLSRGTGGVPVLWVEPLEWGLDPKGDAFLPIVRMRAQLVKGTTPLWDATCEPPRDPADVAPTRAELRADTGRLRAMIVKRTEACADDLVARFLNRPLMDDRPEKRDIRVTTDSLADVEVRLLGSGSAPGLGAGPARFDARFTGLRLGTGDLERLQRLVRASMRGPADSELELTGLAEAGQFVVSMEKNSAGRIRLTFEGLRLASDAAVDAFLSAFEVPGLRRVQYEGYAGAHAVKVERDGGARPLVKDSR